MTQTADTTSILPSIHTILFYLGEKIIYLFLTILGTAIGIAIGIILGFNFYQLLYFGNDINHIGNNTTDDYQNHYQNQNRSMLDIHGSNTNTNTPMKRFSGAATSIVSSMANHKKDTESDSIGMIDATGSFTNTNQHQHQHRQHSSYGGKDPITGTVPSEFGIE